MFIAMRMVAGHYDYAAKVYHTLALIHASCEADLLPDWLQLLLIKRIEQEIMNGTWPLLSPSAS
jgi:hypothetical protein